jgi:hypothetical protein
LAVSNFCRKIQSVLENNFSENSQNLVIFEIIFENFVILHGLIFLAKFETANQKTEIFYLSSDWLNFYKSKNLSFIDATLYFYIQYFPIFQEGAYKVF